jgi:hypothetical protein
LPPGSVPVIVTSPSAVATTFTVRDGVSKRTSAPGPETLNVMLDAPYMCTAADAPGASVS